MLDTGDGPTPQHRSTVTVEDTSGKDAKLRVVAVLAPIQDTGQTGSLVDEQTFASRSATPHRRSRSWTSPSGCPGSTKPPSRTSPTPGPTSRRRRATRSVKLIGTVFDFLIKAVTGLLLMSVLIALIGIINTMSLSILERRRELGLLRIIGMTDKRVRRMVTLESVLISLLGTLGGMILGLVSHCCWCCPSTGSAPPRSHPASRGSS